MPKTKNNCGFFQTFLNCFSQCTNKNSSRIQYITEIDYFEKELCEPLHLEKLSNQPIYTIPSPASKNQNENEASNEFYRIEVPSNQL